MLKDAFELETLDVDVLFFIAEPLFIYISERFTAVTLSES
jgi:hypothetical protein